MNINKIISLIAVRFLSGITLITLIIIFTFILFNDLHAYLGRFPNSEWLQMSVLAFLLITCVVGLITIFSKNIISEATFDTNQSDISEFTPIQFNFYSLGASFSEGFIKGITSESNKK